MDSQKPATSGLAIAALVFALLFCIPFAPLVGLVLGVIALVQISKSNGAIGGHGVAVAAVATGAIVTVMSIGIIAAIAIPNFIRFQLLSKTSEARTHLGMGAINAQQVAAETGKFPVAEDTGLVPSRPCGTTRCPEDPELWKEEPWTSLGISPGGAGGHYFQYRYKSDGTTFELSATADLDGDGKPSKFEVSGTIDEEGALDVGVVENMAPGNF